MEKSLENYKNHLMKLQPLPFEQIKNGVKDIEVRLFDQKRQNINIGDLITFTQMITAETLTVRVIEINTHPSFGELFNNFEPKRFGAEGYSRDQFIEMMRQYYPEPEELKFGTVGIILEVLE